VHIQTCLEKLALEMLQMFWVVYGQQTLSWSKVFKWCYRFKDSHVLEDDLCRGWPAIFQKDSNVRQIQEVVHSGLFMKDCHR